MQITLTIPDDKADALRVRMRRRLSVQFPQEEYEAVTGQDTDGEDVTQVRERDDPAADAIKLYYERHVEDELDALEIILQEQAKKDASTTAKKHAAIIAQDEARERKDGRTAQRRPVKKLPA